MGGALWLMMLMDVLKPYIKVKKREYMVVKPQYMVGTYIEVTHLRNSNQSHTYKFRKMKPYTLQVQENEALYITGSAK